MQDAQQRFCTRGLSLRQWARRRKAARLSECPQLHTPAAKLQIGSVVEHSGEEKWQWNKTQNSALNSIHLYYPNLNSIQHIFINQKLNSTRHIFITQNLTQINTPLLPKTRLTRGLSLRQWAGGRKAARLLECRQLHTAASELLVEHRREEKWHWNKTQNSTQHIFVAPNATPLPSPIP
jgi:hypothetical protein